MENTMQSQTWAELSVTWTDNAGNPAKTDGPTTWDSDDTDGKLATIEVAPGNSQIANIHSLGPIGDVQFQATADADLGEGVKKITAICRVTVIAG